MKYKTLKDFEDMKYPQKVLKVEAVKRFKYKDNNQMCIDDEDWLDFFNITEEDLK